MGALQGIGAAALGPSGVPAPAAARPKEEEPRSFMIKKGDADVQERHQRAQSGMLQRSVSGESNASWGGSTSTAAAPMSREDMEKARKARLEKLEAQQAEKKKQIQDAEEKQKSR